MALRSFVGALAALAIAGLADGAGIRGLFILFGALGLNLMIVTSFFLVRPYATRLRRFLPPWLPW
ncbi:MAG: hypothetical protein V4515_03920 [Chloroflexota bacterium]